VESAIAPYVLERMTDADPQWLRIVERSQRLRSRQLARRKDDESATTQVDVDSTYMRHWSRTLADLLTPKTVAYEWGERGFLMQSLARRRLNHLLLVRALHATKARRILEVGMGNGFNLFLLAAQRPELWLTGLERTSRGIAAARAIAHEPVLPDVIAQLSTEPVVGVEAHRRVTLVHGTAATLPFADRSFEAVCTVLALEQMEAVRDAALAELHRVTHRWAVMIEPFRDLNAEGARFDYVRAMDYFSETIDGLSNHGFRPRVVFLDFPNKLNLHVGLVVAERC